MCLPSNQFQLKMNKFLAILLLLILLCGNVSGQRWISGQVTCEFTNNPLPSVFVQAWGSSIGTRTDINGNYRIEIDSLQTILEFSLWNVWSDISQQVVIGNDSIINVTMNGTFLLDRFTIQTSALKTERTFPKRNLFCSIYTVLQPSLKPILENINYPKRAFENWIQGNVFVFFKIDVEGNITNFEIVRSPDPLLSDEVLSAFQYGRVNLEGFFPMCPYHRLLPITLPIVFRIAAN